MMPAVGHPGLDAGTGTPEAPGPRVFSEWSIAGGRLDLSTPAVMGILNLTPDSFSDGGQLTSVEESLHRAWRLLEEGARILDVGGESTRPGAEPVSEEEELRRVLPFIKKAFAAGLGPLSIDTRHAAVAREALRGGAQIVNDVSGLRHDPEMARVVADEGAGLVLSHMRGTPATMRELAEYGDVASEVAQELEISLSLALDAGVLKERIVVDPGIGFAKTARQSLALLRDLASLKVLDCPILVGPSRKSFIGEVTGLPPEELLPGTLAACVLAYLRGASVFRVHDVAPIVQALSVAQAIEGASPPNGVRLQAGGSGALQDRIQRA
ncbi:MAG: dihydropteroate synthase [Gemmatimonadota bacterium]